MKVVKQNLVKVVLRLGLIFALCLFPFSFPKVSAHRFHTSLTRIDYNAEDKNIEITIQVFTHDLVEILEKINKKRFDLEKSGETDKMILNYLEEKFVLQDKDGQNRKLKWVGKEFKTDSTFIYVEIPSEDGIEKNKLKNTIFFESFPKQTNLVIARYSGKKSDLLFKPGDGFKEITENKEKNRGNS